MELAFSFPSANRFLFFLFPKKEINKYSWTKLFHTYLLSNFISELFASAPISSVMLLPWKIGPRSIYQNPYYFSSDKAKKAKSNIDVNPVRLDQSDVGTLNWILNLGYWEEDCLGQCYRKGPRIRLNNSGREGWKKFGPCSSMTNTFRVCAGETLEICYVCTPFGILLKQCWKKSRRLKN